MYNKYELQNKFGQTEGFGLDRSIESSYISDILPFNEVPCLGKHLVGSELLSVQFKDIE